VIGLTFISFLFAADKPVETFQTAMAKQRAAMEIQRTAVRKQMELAVEWRGESADCDPIPEVELTPLIDSAAQGNQLNVSDDEYVVHAAEWHFCPDHY